MAKITLYRASRWHRNAHTWDDLTAEDAMYEMEQE